jgi:hypothetical protein
VPAALAEYVPPPPEPPFAPLLNPAVPPNPPPVEVIVLNTEFDPLLPELADDAAPPAPTVIV